MIVLVECYSDTALVRALGVQRRNLLHEFCKGNVMNGLRKAASDAVGVIDADPDSQNPPAELLNYREAENGHGLRLLVHAQEPRKKVIEVSPRLEEWLVGRADVCKIDLAQYGLPQTAREIKRIPRYDKKPGFQRFLQDLLGADAGMKTLKTWLGV
jgi:hypothetical protein